MPIVGGSFFDHLNLETSLLKQLHPRSIGTTSEPRLAPQRVDAAIMSDEKIFLRPVATQLEATCDWPARSTR